MMPEHVFHISLYLWNMLSSPKPSALLQGPPPKNQALREVPQGVSRVFTLYALAKQAQNLGAFKLARTCFAFMEKLVVPSAWQQQIDLACLALRSRPFSDSEELMSVCNRCMTTNPLLRNNCDGCSTCAHPFVRTFLGFEVLPLVEFAPEPDIPIQEVIELINREPTRRGGGGGDGWQEVRMGAADTLVLGGEDEADLFVQRMLDAAAYIVPGEPYQVVRVDRETLVEVPPEEVFIIDGSKVSPHLPIQYYRLMIPDIPVTLCKVCGHFFHQETWELEFLKTGSCPFCKAEECEWSLAEFKLGQ